jgi:hypothetical protein
MAPLPISTGDECGTVSSKAKGPERLAMEWWIDGSDAADRDYFRVEDDQGHRFWIYREGHYGPVTPHRVGSCTGFA